VGDGADASCWSTAGHPRAAPPPTGRRLAADSLRASRLADARQPRARGLVVVVVVRFGLNRYGLLQKNRETRGARAQHGPNVAPSMLTESQGSYLVVTKLSDSTRSSPGILPLFKGRDSGR
jgi:hypothetical protein